MAASSQSANLPAFEIVRSPIIVSFDERAAYSEVYGFTGNQGRVFLEGQLITPVDHPSDTIFLFMHPSSTLNLMPLPAGMAAAGKHVMCCASRFAKNDSALIMEKVTADLGAFVRHARHQLGYRRVVLVGWSGGGSLALFYQAEAEKPSVFSTPAGDPYDLSAHQLEPADAVVVVAAHAARARILSEWLDPAVADENDPSKRLPEFDLYDRKQGPTAPYSADFVAAFRQAQKARMRRITQWVKEELETLSRQGGRVADRAFVVHRTMADPRWLDPAVDPNDRAPGRCFLGDPELANSAPAGLGRFNVLRSWLSQWSVDDSNIDGERSIARIDAPLLIVENSADDGVPRSHIADLARSAAESGRRYEHAVIEGATHYYQGQPELCRQAAAVIGTWSDTIRT